MEQITIGKTSFNADSLKGVDLETAQHLFKNVDPRIVKKAHEMANPKRKVTAKPKRKRKK